MVTRCMHYRPYKDRCQLIQSGSHFQPRVDESIFGFILENFIYFKALSEVRACRFEIGHALRFGGGSAR